jgi:hypothetical protein
VPVAAAAISIVTAAALLFSLIKRREDCIPPVDEDLLLRLSKEGDTPIEGAAFDMSKKPSLREYFDYVNVAEIPYPEHPRNTTDKWHKTDSSPSDLISALGRIRVMMPKVINKDGYGAPSHEYWQDYWRKYDWVCGFQRWDSRSWAWAYRTFYGFDIVTVAKYRNHYDAVSGYHRLWLAKKMGFEMLPVWVIELGDA